MRFLSISCGHSRPSASFCVWTPGGVTGGEYILCFSSSRSVSSLIMSEEDGHFIVRCRGLPWSTTVEEVKDFFSGVQFSEGDSSVHLTMTRDGRPSGEAYVELASEEDVEAALKMDRKHMGKRYVEGEKELGRCIILH